MNAREFVLRHCSRLKIGEEIVLEDSVVREGFPCGWRYHTHNEALLSCLPGAAWGAYRVTHKMEDGLVVISRHKEGKRRVSVDPDREHLYRRIPDGTYVPRDE